MSTLTMFIYLSLIISIGYNWHSIRDIKTTRPNVFLEPSVLITPDFQFILLAEEKQIRPEPYIFIKVCKQLTSVPILLRSKHSGLRWSRMFAPG